VRRLPMSAAPAFVTSSVQRPRAEPSGWPQCQTPRSAEPRASEDR
jgi:hypothetical protein